MLEHVVHFYDRSPPELVEGAARPVREALRRGDVSLIVAQSERLNALQQQLETEGIDCRDAVKRGRLEFMDAHEVLGKIVFAGRPDPEAFDRVVGDTLRQLLSLREARTVHVYGEMVGVLWSEGNEEAAVELERLWNGLLADLPVSLYCAYPIAGFDRSVWDESMEAVLDAHTQVIPENLITRGA
jgi:hypothetical protein